MEALIWAAGGGVGGRFRGMGGADLGEFLFQLRLEGVEPSSFRTAQEAMAAAEGVVDPVGSIVFVGEAGSEPREVIVYLPGGRIAVGAGVPEDDFEDEPWTAEEIAANRRLARRWREQGRGSGAG